VGPKANDFDLCATQNAIELAHIRPFCNISQNKCRQGLGASHPIRQLREWFCYLSGERLSRLIRGLFGFYWKGVSRGKVSSFIVPFNSQQNGLIDICLFATTAMMWSWNYARTFLDSREHPNWTLSSKIAYGHPQFIRACKFRQRFTCAAQWGATTQDMFGVRNKYIIKLYLLVSSLHNANNNHFRLPVFCVV
jgi:hypothetical protein